MTLNAIACPRILSQRRWLHNHVVIVHDGIIEEVVPCEAVPKDIPLQRLDKGCLLPGFIDTQVNGGGGVLFNDQPSIAGIQAIAGAHRAFGTTALLPTLISDDLAIIAQAIAAVDSAIEHGVPGIIGIHIEGPFLNSGKRGIHDAGKFRVLDDAAIALLSSLKRGKTLVTLAPEQAPTGAIAALVAAGVIVSAGHTLATYDDVRRAIGEGLSGVTHLFNAMTQMESRAPGVVGAALDSDLFCGIIVDGHHVHSATLRAAYHARGKEGLMLVTDAMPTVGSTATNFTLGERTISLKNGALLSDDGTLAGSNLNMGSALRNAVSMMHVPLEDAAYMASATPAQFLGIKSCLGQIAPTYQADLVHLDDAMMVQATWVAGHRL
jgi:N-acetylglucosamine-6-phosphate deacetylase